MVAFGAKVKHTLSIERPEGAPDGGKTTHHRHREGRDDDSYCPALSAPADQEHNKHESRDQAQDSDDSGSGNQKC